MKYLGIDYGTKHIGIALSDENGTIAFPYGIIERSKRSGIEIGTLAAKESVAEVVIGESLDMFGRPNKIMNDIAHFAMELGEETGLSVRFEKEFLTSHHATPQKGKSAMHARQTKKMQGGGREPVDASAAALILQRFLDKVNAKK